MKHTFVLALLLLTGCITIPDTRPCLVSLNGRCLQYDFNSDYFKPEAPRVCDLPTKS
jgi:hypothetical protein